MHIFFRRTQKFVQLSRLEFFFLFLSFSLSSLVFFRLVCLSLMTVMMMSRATMDDGV